jgi:hypothetical protein
MTGKRQKTREGFMEAVAENKIPQNAKFWGMSF